MDLTSTHSDEGEQLAADTPPGDKGEHAAAGTAVAKESHDHHRRVMPRLDLDESIAAAREAIKQAKKDMMEARRVNKNEKRKKKRLLRKAAQLSSEDLERIAVLKRCELETRDAQGANPKRHGTARQMSGEAGTHRVSKGEPMHVDKAAMEATVTAE
jgi:hypothetical protein